MSSLIQIVLPVENANDETVLIVALPYSQGTYVNKGVVICEIETSKSILAITAETNGYFYSYYTENQEVKPGEVLGYISQEIGFKKKVSHGNDNKNEKKFSKKALNLIESNNLSAEVFGSLSRVMESDVIEYLKQYNFESIENKFEFTAKDFETEHIILWGAGLQAVVVLDLLESVGQMDRVKCIIDVKPSLNCLSGIPVISSGRLSELITLGARNFHICIGDTSAKCSVAQILESEKLNLITLLHPNASISKSAKIGNGVYVGAFVYIGPEAVVEDYCTINTGATLAHHTKIGKFVMISDACHIGGSVTVGSKSNLGIGVIVNRDIKIGNKVGIPSGQKIFNHVKDGTVVKFK